MDDRRTDLIPGATSGLGRATAMPLPGRALRFFALGPGLMPGTGPARDISG
ncbi:MAG: hypothetical protein ACT4QA_20070 [Panacagrimonas sp.]